MEGDRASVVLQGGVAGSAVLAPLLKIICFHAQRLQRSVCVPQILLRELSYPPSKQILLTACMWGCPGGCGALAKGPRRCHSRAVTPGAPRELSAGCHHVSWLWRGVFRVSSFAEGFERISLPNGLNYSHSISPVTG